MQLPSPQIRIKQPSGDYELVPRSAVPKGERPPASNIQPDESTHGAIGKAAQRPRPILNLHGKTKIAEPGKKERGKKYSVVLPSCLCRYTNLCSKRNKSLTLMWLADMSPRGVRAQARKV